MSRKPDLPTEPGLYWCSMGGKTWDCVLEIRDRAPYLKARIISVGQPIFTHHEVDESESSYPRLTGPKIDQPSFAPPASPVTHGKTKETGDDENLSLRNGIGVLRNISSDLLGRIGCEVQFNEMDDLLRQLCREVGIMGRAIDIVRKASSSEVIGGGK